MYHFVKSTLLASSLVFGLGLSSSLAANFRSIYTVSDKVNPTINTVFIDLPFDIILEDIDKTKLKNNNSGFNLEFVGSNPHIPTYTSVAPEIFIWGIIGVLVFSMVRQN